MSGDRQNPSLKKIEIFNYRPVAYAAAALALGIVAGASVYNSLAGAICIAVFLLAAIIVAFWCKLRVLRILSVAGAIGFVLISMVLNINPVSEGVMDNAYVSGRVTSIEYIAEHNREYKLENVTVNGNKVPACALLKSQEIFEVGDLVEGYGRVKSIGFRPNNLVQASYYADNIKHIISFATIVKTGESKLRFTEYIRVALSERLIEFMGEEAGGFALALTIGDKAYLSEELKDSMRASGLAHLVVVSGLHVGFLCGIVFIIARLFKRGKTQTIGIITIALFVYAAITGFPTGVMRASVMSVCYLVALRKEERFDPLNALSLAALIMMAFDPISVFDLSFLMSIGAVLGITCFYTTFVKMFKIDGNRFLGAVSSSLCMSLSANTYLLGIMISTFGTFSLYFAIANVFAVPYISMVYSLLVPISALSLIIKPLGYLLVPIKYLIYVFNYFSSFIASLPLAVIKADISFAVAAIYCVALFFVSKFNLLNWKVKVGYAVASATVITLLIVL